MLFRSHAMVALNVKTLAAVGHRADENGLPWPIIIPRIALRRLLPGVPIKWHEVEHAGREVANDAPFLMSEVLSRTMAENFCMART